MSIKLEIQERKVILSHIDKIINQSSDNLLVECLYSLAVQLSPKNSAQQQRYKTLLNDLRSIEGQITLDPTPVGELAELSASNGYYYFKIKDNTFGELAILSHTVLKSYYGFTWKGVLKSWQLKQNTKLPLNIDEFVLTITPKLNDDFKKFKSLKK